MSRKVLGIEIRKDSIAAVLLDTGFKGSELLSQGFFPVSQEETEDEGIKEALKAMAGQLKPSGTSCVLGIPTTAISFRNISVPFSDTKKIKQILPFELEPSLATPVEDLVIDFEAVKQEGHQDLLTFTIPKVEIERYTDLLGSVNIRPASILPGGYAAARFISEVTTDNNDFLLIDTGNGDHTLYAVSGGVVRLARTFPMASDGAPVLRNLEKGIRRTITAFQESQGITIDPASVFSTGPQSAILEEKHEKVSISGMPVTSIEAIRAFPGLQKVPESSEWASGRFDIALALALMEAESVGGVNFSSRQSTLSHFWNENRGNIITTAIFLLLTLTTLMASQILAVKQKERKLADLDRQIESVFKNTFPDVTRVVDPLQQMQIKIKETGENSVHPDLPGTRIRVIDILNALSLQIPKPADVKIHRMVVGTDNVVLSGNTDTFNTVDEVKNGLGKATIFSNVTISSADLEKSGKRVRFKLKLDF